MDILRVTALWTGFMGAPGYSNFHFTIDGGFWDGGIVGDEAAVAAQTAADRVSDAFGELSAYLPAAVTISIENEAQILDSDSGEILGFAEVDASSTSGSPGGSGWSAASGAVVNWRTNDYRFGRRIRGRTFLVPLRGTAYEADGTLSPGGRGAAQDFADTMVGSAGGPEFGVWSRPRDGAGGVFATATAANVPDMAAVLRSRRD